LRFFQFRFCTGRIHFLNWRLGPNPRSPRWQAQVPPAEAGDAAFSDHQGIIDMSQFEQTIFLLIAIALFGAIVATGFCVAPAVAAALSHRADVNVAITAMWSVRERAASLRNRLGPLCLRRLSTDDSAVTTSGESDMTLLNYVSSSASRHPAAIALIMGAIGFVVGFLLSLAVAAQSLYVCTEIM
jgi:hypothetical protein